jgi:nucleoside-triphosphatase
VTGSPGIGKTTVLLKTVEALKAEGYRAGGMISRDVRSSGNRIGFEVLDLSSGKKGCLANVDQQQGPQVGRYRVNLDDLNNVGVKAILHACENLDVVIVDEIGPMELFSEQFREAVRKTVESGKLLICTVHWKMKNDLIDNIKKREDVEMYVVAHDNREHLHEIITRRAVDFFVEG